MFKKLATSVGLAGIVSGLAIAAPSPVQAQLVVTGGSIGFQGTQVYVPASGSRSDIYDGSAAVLVKTPGISINDNVLLRSQILPQLNSCCNAPKVGDTGTWLPTLTFMAYSNAGEPTLFRNIPAELNFRIDSLTSTGASAAINRFDSYPVLLIQSGTAVNASSFGGVVRTTPVVVVEYGQTPSSTLESYGIASVRPGTNYPSDINATITGGTVSAPLANSFTGLNNAPSASGAPNNGTNGSFFATASTYVGAFNSVTSIVSVYGLSSDGSSSGSGDGSSSGSGDGSSSGSGDGSTSGSGNGSTAGTGDGSTSGSGDGSSSGSNQGQTEGNTDEDEDTIFVDRTNNVRYVIVGLPSRVFPGMIGVEGISTSD